MKKGKVYIITGPTAVGKSQVAIEFAKKVDGEIINCDSVQLYKYMDIGSAKPSEEDFKTVKHHLYGIVDPSYNMTAATYQKLVFACIDNVISRGKIPVICGGTGLYINSILYKMDFAGDSEDSVRRKELEKMAEENGNEYMHHYLTAIDPKTAEKIHPNNLRKVIRAIEAFEVGDGIKSLNECEINDAYDFEFFALQMDRELLYSRINNRVNQLMDNGLLNEVEFLIKFGFKDAPALKSIGYKELIEYLDGNIDLDTAIENIKKNTRHYAKRQYTWFNRYDDVNWIEVDAFSDPVRVAETILTKSLSSEG